LKTFNFVENNADKCIYRTVVNKNIVCLTLFVDDGLILNKSSDTVMLDNLSKVFEITTGGREFIRWYENARPSQENYVVHQTIYLPRIIKKFNMTDANVSVPANPHATLAVADSDCQEFSNVPYREAVGSFIFLALITRPNIAYTVNVVSCYVC